MGGFSVEFRLDQTNVNSTKTGFDVILFESMFNYTMEDNAERFIKNINSYPAVWRPKNFIEVYDNTQVYKVHLKVNPIYSGLTHTGPYKMMVGDQIYVLPPLQTLNNHDYSESSPYCFKFADTHSDKAYVYPMIVIKELYLDFYSDWWMCRVERNQRLHSKIGRKLGDNGLKEIRSMWKIKPIGLIIRKQDYYGESNEICHGDRFDVKWYTS